MKRVLVTGASGWIGTNTLRPLLMRGYEVHAVSRRDPGLEGVEHHKADLLNEADVRELVSSIKPTHLLHLAWYAEHQKFWTSVENLHWLRASVLFIEELARSGGQRMVVAGTCAEYDWQDGVCSESNTACAPVTLYGAAKLALYEVAKSYCTQIGMSWAWGRIFFLYGPAEPAERLVAAVARALLRGEPVKTTSGRQRRDYLHVADAGDAFAALLESDVSGPVNIASGVPVRVRDIVEAIAGVVGRRDLLEIGGLADRPGDPPLIVATTDRLRHEVGWSQRIGLEDGLRSTVEWWRQRQ